MTIGYIVNGSHQSLQTIDVGKVSFYTDKPILIVGVEFASLHFKEYSWTDKHIKDNIYWCFSSEDATEKYQENISNFLKHCFTALVKPINTHYVSNPEQIKIAKDKIISVDCNKTLVTISTDQDIYYFNLEIVQFLYPSFSLQTFLNHFPNKKLCWENVGLDDPTYIPAFLKAAHNPITKHSLQILYQPYGDIEMYLGWIGLSYYSDKDITVWNNAYIAENMLSDLKIKVNADLLRDLVSDNSIIETIYDNLIDKCFVQQTYNGTNKTTGRIFANDDGFSLQSLPKPLRNIVVAKQDSFLLEFDYKHFEYSILSQLCNLPQVEDPHEQLAIDLFQDKELRQKAKGINYSLIYGKSINTIIKELAADGITVDRHKFEVLLEPISSLQERLEKEFTATGCIINLFGRNVYPTKQHAVLNNYISSTAADFFIIKLLEIQKLLTQYKDCSIVLQNHDSVLINLTTQVIDTTEVSQEIMDILSSPLKGIKCGVDLKYGTNWRDLR